MNARLNELWANAFTQQASVDTITQPQHACIYRNLRKYCKCAGGSAASGVTIIIYEKYLEKKTLKIDYHIRINQYYIGVMSHYMQTIQFYNVLKMIFKMFLISKWKLVDFVLLIRRRLTGVMQVETQKLYYLYGLIGFWTVDCCLESSIYIFVNACKACLLRINELYCLYNNVCCLLCCLSGDSTCAVAECTLAFSEF